MLLRILPAIALLICSASASAQVTLQPKYPEGSKFNVQTELKSTQTLTLAGMDLDTQSTTFITSKRSVGKRAADGTLKVEDQISSLQSDISLPGGLKLNFDSGNPNKEASIPQLEPILEVFRAICRLPVTIELDSKDKITSVKLPEGEFEKLPEPAKERLSPETMKKTLEEAANFLPDGPVKKGDTWERSNENNVGGGQVLTFRTKYEYAGTVEKDGMTLDKITGKVLDVTFAINGNAQLQVTKSDLKATESDSTFLFNRDAGYLVSKNSKTKIEGPLTLVINNMELPGKVDLVIEESVARQK